MASRPDIRYSNCYVCGTMAYQMDQAPVRKKKARLPKARKHKKQYIAIYPIPMIAIAVAVVFLIMLGIGIGQTVGASREAARMQQYVAALQEENTRLEQEFRAGFDENEIREIATAMGMIPGENAQQIPVQVMVPQKPAEESAWDNFCAFLAGLFA